MRKTLSRSYDVRDPDERGFALPAVLLYLIVLSLLGAAAWETSRSEARSSRAVRFSAEAFYAAEAGLREVVGNWSPSYESTATGDSVVVGWTELENGSGFRASIVRLDDASGDGPPMYRITSSGRGRGPRAATRTVGTTVRVKPGLPQNAVTAGGDFEIDGNPDIPGVCSDMHANGDFTISGNPTASEGTTVTGTGTVSASNLVCDGSGCGDHEGGISPQDIHDFDAWDFCGEADYWLRQGGGTRWLVDVAAADSVDLVNGAADDLETYGWEFDGSLYQTIQEDVSEGTYCADGDVEIADDVGSAADPGHLTLLVDDGSVRLSGNPYFSAAHSQDILFMAEGDMILSGNATAGFDTFEGLAYVDAQCRIDGNPTISGQVVCRNVHPHPGSDWVPVGGMGIDGNPTISSGCDGFGSDGGAVLPSSRGWVESR